MCPEDTQGGQAAGPGPWQRQARGLREGRETFVICTQPRGEVSRGIRHLCIVLLLAQKLQNIGEY